jgi:hypothetical protein
VRASGNRQHANVSVHKMSVNRRDGQHSDRRAAAGILRIPALIFRRTPRQFDATALHTTGKEPTPLSASEDR